jgi:hypothetical protein
VGSALPRPTSSNSSRSSGSAKGFSMGAVIALCFACLLLGHVGVLQPMAELLSGVREGGWAGGGGGGGGPPPPPRATPSMLPSSRLAAATAWTALLGVLALGTRVSTTATAASSP